MWINEIYFDPPGGGDFVLEYVELRGTPGAALANHYLIFLENEQSTTANPGLVEAVFDLGVLTTPQLGANGYLLLRQAGNAYTGIPPQATNLQNVNAAIAWGSGPVTSSVGFSDEGANGVLENSGFTALLLRNDGGPSKAPFAPTATSFLDLDADNNGQLDAASPLASWFVYDSIGVNAESSDITGMLYGAVNFSAGTPAGGGFVPPGSIFVDVGFEIEWIGRWGDSTGSTAADWHAANLTDDSGSGSAGVPDFRQAGDPHGFEAANQFVETSQGLPYGTKVTASLGGPNPFVKEGDYNPRFDAATKQFVFDGRVDGADLLAWQRWYGFGGGLYATREHADGSLNRTVDDADLAIWATAFGSSSGQLAAQSVPEPSAGLAALGCAAAGGGSRRRIPRGARCR